jgi:hypothetical protein
MFELTRVKTEACVFCYFQELALILAPHAPAQFLKSKTHVVLWLDLSLNLQQSIADAARIHVPSTFRSSSRCPLPVRHFPKSDSIRALFK